MFCVKLKTSFRLPYPPPLWITKYGNAQWYRCGRPSAGNMPSGIICSVHIVCWKKTPTHHNKDARVAAAFSAVPEVSFFPCLYDFSQSIIVSPQLLQSTVTMSSLISPGFFPVKIEDVSIIGRIPASAVLFEGFHCSSFTSRRKTARDICR